MRLWLIVLALGALTFAVRVGPILLLGRLKLPGLVLRAFRYVAPAVLSAIVIPELAVRDGSLAVSLENPRLVAGLLAGLVAWRTRNVLLTLIVGMGVLWGLTAFFG